MEQDPSTPHPSFFSLILLSQTASSAQMSARTPTFDHIPVLFLPSGPPPHTRLPARETFVPTGAFQTNGVLRRRPPTLRGATANPSCLTFGSGVGSTPRSAWWISERSIWLPHQTFGCMSKHKFHQASIGEINTWPDTVGFFFFSWELLVYTQCGPHTIFLRLLLFGIKVWEMG